MQNENNKFIDNLYHEFEQKLFKVFGFGINGLKQVLDSPPTATHPGHCLDTIFKNAFDEAGAPLLRWHMHNVIVCLEYIYMSDRLGRKATYEEWKHHILSLNIGMTEEDLQPFDETEMPDFVES